MAQSDRIGSGVARLEFWTALATIALASSWLFVPGALSPVAPVVAAAGIAAVALALRRPFLICLLFVALSFFRIHEAYPLLFTLRLPFALAAMTAAALVWHMGIIRSVNPVWPLEIRAFLVFFAIATVGIGFAENRSAALEYWTSTFTRIGLMTLVIAWLPRRLIDFRAATWIVATSGALVAAVAVANKVSGIGLVEGSRVTIGRDIGSVLGDPNDLALLLLVPLAFSAVLVARGSSWIERVVGVVEFGLILTAIVFTESRGGLLGVLATFAVIGARVVRSKALLIGIALAAIASLYGAMDIAGRMSTASDDELLDVSANERLITWTAALNMAKTKPLTGVGLVNFSDSFPTYTPEPLERSLTAHSTWLGVLAETGIPGFAAFMVMMLAAIRSCVRTERALARAPVPRAAQGVGLALLASFAGFCVAGSFLSQGFGWTPYVLVALTVALARAAPDIIEPPRAGAVAVQARCGPSRRAA